MKVAIKKVYTWCDQCEKTIYVGDDMWFKGTNETEYFCHISCLIASFNHSKKKQMNVNYERKKNVSK